MNGTAILGAYVRTYYDIQRTRLAMGERIRAFKQGRMRGADDEAQAVIISALEGLYAEYQEDEEKIQKDITKELRNFPLWVEWLGEVPGVGPIMGAVILTSYNIEIATTVSKLWQFTGLNPGMVAGWKPDGKDKDGKPKWKRTTEQIRADRKTAGFRCPFNSWLRSKMIGVLAESFIRSQADYAVKYYYPLHVPKARRDELGCGRLDAEEGWKDKSEGHRSNAAKRYMVKMFLRDLYVAWRTLEGLEVRPPYAEEYLGKKHSA